MVVPGHLIDKSPPEPLKEGALAVTKRVRLLQKAPVTAGKKQEVEVLQMVQDSDQP